MFVKEPRRDAEEKNLLRGKEEMEQGEQGDGAGEEATPSEKKVKRKETGKRSILPVHRN